MGKTLPPVADWWTKYDMMLGIGWLAVPEVLIGTDLALEIACAMSDTNGIAWERATPQKPPVATSVPFVSAVAPATTLGPLPRM